MISEAMLNMAACFPGFFLTMPWRIGLIRRSAPTFKNISHLRRFEHVTLPSRPRSPTAGSVEANDGSFRCLRGVAVGDGTFMRHKDVQGGFRHSLRVRRGDRRTGASRHEQQHQETTSKPNHGHALILRRRTMPPC